MRAQPTSPDTIEFAQESLRMSKEKGGDKTFRILAIGMMLVTGLSTAFHALHAVVRDMRGRRESHERDHDYRRAYPPRGVADYNPAASQDAEFPHEESAPRRRWTTRDEPRGRYAEDEENRERIRRQPGRSIER